MANFIIGYDNAVARAQTIVTASSEATGLAASRLKDFSPRRRFRTAPGITNFTITVDFGTPRAIDVVALQQPVDAGGESADGEALGYMAASDTIQHRFDNVTPGNGVLGSSGLINCGIEAGYGIHVWKPSARITARYWHITVNAASLVSSPSYVDIGTLFAGVAFQPLRNMAYGWGKGRQLGRMESEAARSGLRQFARGRGRRTLAFTAPWLTIAEAKNTVEDMQRIADRAPQVLAIPDIDGGYVAREAVLGTLEQIAPVTQPNFAVFENVFQIKEII